MNTKIITARKPRTMRPLLLAVGLIGSGLLLFAAPGPAQADPPRHAPAYGYRRDKDRDDDRRDRWRDDRRDDRERERNERERRERERLRNRDRDHDGIPDYRDRRPTVNDRWNRWGNNNDSWRRADSDRDGIPNYRDRHPGDRRRH